jgi:glycosidase
LFKGKPIALNPEWSDILDLKFEGNEETLWVELIDILKYWCQLDVDGFRMDVASGVPMQFWLVILMQHNNVIYIYIYSVLGDKLDMKYQLPIRILFG